MSHTEHDEPILRTSPARVGKMLAIIIGLIIVGSAIFFANWDYWISSPPPAGLSKQEPTKGPAVATGKEINVSLKFIESPDFRTLAFNALPGEAGNNPEIKVKSGDSVTIKVKNAGKSFHSFGVVTNPEDITTVVWGSAIRDANNPLKPNEEGETTFTAGAPGTYYYICTVPGHALQGMKGSFIVE